MSWLIVFVSAAVIDVVYISYFAAVRDKLVGKAILCSMLLGVCGLVGMVGVIDDSLLSIPYLAGLGVGTAIGMKWTNREAET